MPRPLRSDVRPLSQAVALGLDRRKAEYSGTVAIELQVTQATRGFELHAERMTIDRLSLSREGCLFRTQEAMPPGLELNLVFPLPLGRMVSTRARVLRQLGDQVAMAFANPPAQSTRAIDEYVESRLAIL